MTHYRLTLTALVIAAVGLEPTNEGYAPSQPIAYSHTQHAGERNINCLYCHYAAERGRYAGIPPLSVCAGCHDSIEPKSAPARQLAEVLAAGQPVAWVLVHKLPDHAYFHHGAHLAAGLKCQQCHGPVETMARVRQHAPLTMGWCVDCHRQRASSQTSVDGEPSHEQRLTDCALCHH